MQGGFAKGIRSRTKVVEGERHPLRVAADTFESSSAPAKHLIYPTVINDALFC